MRLHLSILVLALALLAQPAWAREKPAPVIEAATEPGLPLSAAKVLEKRLARIERILENQSLVDLEMRLESLQQENQQLLSQQEEQAHEIANLKKRQRDLYLDIDRRLSQLEAARAAAPPPSPAPVAPLTGPATVTGGAAAVVAPAAGIALPIPAAGVDASSAPQPVAPAPDTQAEHAAYERAFNLLKEGRYDLAVTAFKTFVATYPHGQYTDNAQYWLGEANYVQRDFKAALGEFEKVVNNFADSPKRPDALLKMGYAYLELGDIDKARLTLNSVMMNYPDTTAARLANKRLQELRP